MKHDRARNADAGIDRLELQVREEGLSADGSPGPAPCNSATAAISSSWYLSWSRSVGWAQRSLPYGDDICDEPSCSSKAARTGFL
ncbi:MAG: hypothetical protein WCB02_28010 [Bradyrhizobium sp.]